MRKVKFRKPVNLPRFPICLTRHLVLGIFSLGKELEGPGNWEQHLGCWSRIRSLMLCFWILTDQVSETLKVVIIANAELILWVSITFITWSEQNCWAVWWPTVKNYNGCEFFHFLHHMQMSRIIWQTFTDVCVSGTVLGARSINRTQPLPSRIKVYWRK